VLAEVIRDLAKSILTRILNGISYSFRCLPLVAFDNIFRPSYILGLCQSDTYIKKAPGEKCYKKIIYFDVGWMKHMKMTVVSGIPQRV